MKKISVNKTVLQNGLTVITSYRDSDIFSMGVGIKVGSFYESESNNGISHMIEHMIFKGTAKRDVDKLNDDIEKLAGNFDIYTTYHQTVLTLDVMKNKGKDCFEIVSDMLMNSTFPEKEFKLEKKVIVEEIKMAEDDPEDCSYLGLYKEAFPEKYYRYNIAGTIKSVRSINLDMLHKFYNEYYIPDNTVICVVSSYSHEEIINMIEQYFGNWQRGNTSYLKHEEQQIIPKKVVRHKIGMTQTHILYGFDIQHLNKREEFALTLLNEKIGAGANSVLFRELRDRKGYAYNVYSDIDFIPNLKMFYIYAGISEENLNDTLSIIDSVVERCRNSALELDEKSIMLVKEKFLTDTAIALESSSHIVDFLLGGEMDYGNPIQYQDFLENIDGITVDHIKAVANKVFINPIIHILSPKK
jgi:predicted Zn-dependent peptidase